MAARLGFAIATDVQPDILILDEVLSVGDERFKNKCKQRMEKLWDAKATVLMVSHDLKLVRQSCQRVVWLDKGRIRFSGNTDEALQCYLDSVTNRFPFTPLPPDDCLLSSPPVPRASSAREKL